VLVFRLADTKDGGLCLAILAIFDGMMDRTLTAVY
jgi:hypothetical protein